LDRIRLAISRSKDDIKEVPEFTSTFQQIARLQESVDHLAQQCQPKVGWFTSGVHNQDGQLIQHMSAVLWFLSHKYSMLSKAFNKITDDKQKGKEHLKRLQDKRLAALASVQLKSPTPQVSRDLAVPESKLKVEEFAQKYGLSSDQVQMLQHEKQELFNELQDMQGQMRQTEKSVAEIARLQTTLQESLMYQETQIERLYDDIDLTIDMVQKGNMYLNKASKNQSAFSKIMVFLILFMTAIMLFMHLYLD
jgi:DNA repair exonuclease SbcCD ATPase subunit